MSFSGNYFGTISTSQSEIAFRNTATETTSIPYLKKTQTKSSEELKTEARIIDSFLEIPESIAGISEKLNLSIDVATKDRLITGVTRIPHYGIKEEVEKFIVRQKKSIKFRNDIYNMADRVSSFLIKENIDAEVTVDLFIDSEYSDWAEPKIQIIVRKEQLGKAYDALDKLLTYAFKGISQKNVRRISVNLDSR